MKEDKLGIFKDLGFKDRNNELDVGSNNQENSVENKDLRTNLQEEVGENNEEEILSGISKIINDDNSEELISKRSDDTPQALNLKDVEKGIKESELDYERRQLEEKEKLNAEIASSDVVSKIDFDAISKLEQVMFFEQLRKKREADLVANVSDYEKQLREANVGAFARQKALSSYKKEQNNDLYSIEKELYKTYESKTTQLEDLQKSAKKANQHSPAELKELNEKVKVLKTELAGGAEVFIETKIYHKDIFDKYQEKFAEVAQKNSNFIARYANPEIEHDKLKKADATKAAFNGMFPEVRKQLEKEFLKAKSKTPEQKAEKSLLSTACKVLSTASLFYNPVMGIATRVLVRIAKTDRMQEFKKDMLSQVSKGLDAIGIEKGTKLRTAVKLMGAGVAGFAALGVAAMYAADGDLEGALEISKNAGNSLVDLGRELSTNIDAAKIAEKLSFAKDVIVNSDVVAEAMSKTAEVTKEVVDNTIGAVEPSVINIAIPDSFDYSELTKIDLPSESAPLSNTVNILDQDFTALADVNAPLEQQFAVDLPLPEQPIDMSVAAIPPVEIEMAKYVVNPNDTLSGIMETLDSAQYDLQGESLNKAVALIAEMNGISDPNSIMAGMTIDIPKDTAALQALMEQNADRLAGLNTDFASVDFSKPEVPMESMTDKINKVESMLEAKNAVADIATNLTVEQQLIVNAIEVTTSNATYSDMIAQKLILDSPELQEQFGLFRNPDQLAENIRMTLNDNIQAQMDNGTFPTDIEFTLSADNSSAKEIITFDASELSRGHDVAIESSKEKVALLQEKLAASMEVNATEEMELPANGQPKHTASNLTVPSNFAGTSKFKM